MGKLAVHKQISPTMMIVGLIVAIALSACQQLPASGPGYRVIMANATTTLESHGSRYGDEERKYAIIDISPSVVSVLKTVKPFSFFYSLKGRNRRPSAIRIGAGDLVQVTVYEQGGRGSLFGAQPGSVTAGAGAAGNNAVLPAQRVTRDGTIAIPYAGRIRVAGNSIRSVEHIIEKRLSNRAIEPQVIVSIIEQNSAAVAMVGDALNSANRFFVTGAGERLLDMISKAGGLRYPGYEVFVTVQRHGIRATSYFPSLVNDPRENIYVQPGDTVNVFRRQQKFIALGALGSTGATQGITGAYAFEQERLTLNEALAKAGWLEDTRANPSQVFLYRIEHRKVLDDMGVDLKKFPTEMEAIPTVYRVDYREPTAFFFAQEFQMRHKDILYVANADSVEVGKFLAYLSLITSTVSGTVGDVKFTKDTIKTWGTVR